MSKLAEVVAPARLGRDFRWLLASSWTTYLGDGITLAAGPLLVASQTLNPLAVAMAALLQRLPWLMFGLYAGVVADRVSRRAIVITTGLVRVTILTVLIASIITRRVDTAVVLAALFLFGVNETFADTATTTLPPMLVDKRDLGIANSRTLGGMIIGNQLAGPPIGAALFAAGMALPFISETVCVLAGVLLITRMRLPARTERARSSRVRDEIREGWHWLWIHPAVRTLAITIFTFNITFGAAWSVLVLYSRQRLGMGAIGFGLITTAHGRGRDSGHGLLRLARTAGSPRGHHAGRAHYRDPHASRSRADPLDVAGADHLHDFRRPRVHLGHHLDERAAAGGAR